MEKRIEPTRREERRYAPNGEEDEESEVMEVRPFKVKGNTYLKAGDNSLFDLETKEFVGVWNVETQEIDEEGGDAGGSDGDDSEAGDDGEEDSEEADNEAGATTVQTTDKPAECNQQ